MGTNQFLPFCPTDTGTNLMSQVDYAASDMRLEGNEPGIALLELNNKALRQSNAVVSQIAQFIADRQNANVLDDGVSATMLAQIISAFDRELVANYAASQALSVTTNSIARFTAVATATLPTAVGNTGKVFGVINTAGGYNVTVNTTSAQTIGGFASGAIVLAGANNILIVVSNGVNWDIHALFPPPVSMGGTGLTAGTSGGIPYFSSTSAMASSALLAAGQVMLGGGAGVTPSTLAAAGAALAYLESAGGTTPPTWRAYTAPTIQVLTGSGNFTANAGAKSCIVYVTGGGGGGGGGDDSNVSSGGGSAGSTAIKTYAASLLTAIAYVVGTGGAGGAAGGSTGSNGVASTFTVGGTALTGGKGNGGNVTGGVGDAASNGDINILPGDGSCGMQSLSAWTPGGTGGSSFWGGGGAGGNAATSTADDGSAGKAYGSGGGGGNGNTVGQGAGGAGKDGTIMIITFYQ